MLELLDLEAAGLYSTIVSKICSIRCESIRWPSATTTSCSIWFFFGAPSPGAFACGVTSRDNAKTLYRLRETRAPDAQLIYTPEELF